RSEREMAEAIRRCGGLSPAACRAVARERFRLETMIERYFSVYERLAEEDQNPERERRALRSNHPNVRPRADAWGSDGVAIAAVTHRAPLVEEVTRLDVLERLAPEWEALWRALPRPTPFQSPAWLITWWRHLGQGRLWTLALRTSAPDCQFVGL